MFGGGRHAGVLHARHAGQRELGHGRGPRVERAVADDFADAIVEIHARRERQVHAMRAQLGGHQPAHGPGQLQTLFGVEVIGMTDAPRRWQQRELGPEALHAPALLVHGHDQRRVARRVDIGDQLAQLLRRLVVAREEDDAADERMAQHLAVLGRELEAGDIDHQWAQSHGTYLSRTATDSTWVVCGNISSTPAASKRKPWAWVSRPRSRASEPVWQEIYTTRCGAGCATALKTSRAPTRGGSNRTLSYPPRSQGIPFSGSTDRSAT